MASLIGYFFRRGGNSNHLDFVNGAVTPLEDYEKSVVVSLVGIVEGVITLLIGCLKKGSNFTERLW